MKKIFLTTLLAIPGFLVADIEIKEGYSVNGSISSTRNTSKYASVEKCNAYADTRSKVVAFTYNSKRRQCTLFKSVRGLKEDSVSTSGILKTS
ncbi:hypothetical protein OAH84_01225 [Gammaproteobacteria bacterium]|nr:hypothetical protein [Gammaproteobacteria bacterium]